MGETNHEEVIWLGMMIDWDAQKYENFWHEKQADGINTELNFSN